MYVQTACHGDVDVGCGGTWAFGVHHAGLAGLMGYSTLYVYDYRERYSIVKDRIKDYSSMIIF